MPAPVNGVVLKTWSPRPDFASHHVPLDTSRVQEEARKFIPNDEADCAEYFDFVGFPNLEGYDPKTRSELAHEAAKELFQAHVEIIPIMEQHLAELQPDPSQQQDEIHEHMLETIKIRRRNAAAGVTNVVYASVRFGVHTTLDLQTQTIETATVEHPVQQRSFG